VLVLVACNTRPSEIVEIPDGYRGPVEITYSSACGPTHAQSFSKTDDGWIFSKRILRVDASGRLCTTYEWREGYGKDEFYYFRDGHRVRKLNEETPHTGMIWARGTRQSGAIHIDHFFVGTETEYRRATARSVP